MTNKILRECLRIALKKNTPELHPEWGHFHHFSFICQDGKIVEYGTNRSGESPIHGYTRRAKIHSEVDAFMKAKGILDRNKPFQIINIRLNKQNELRDSHPCPCCDSFIKSMGANKIWFTTRTGWARQL